MSQLHKLKGPVLVGAILILFLSSPAICSNDKPPVVELAVIVALSGEAQAYGHAVMQGARLAANEINHKGGLLNHHLALVALDNKSSALHAREAALKAVYRKVAGVVGAVWSTHSLAMAPVLQKHRIPMISPGSTAPAVSQIGNFIFRTCYTDDFQGKLMADFSIRDLGHKRAAVLTNINETYSQVLARYFASNFILSGGIVVFERGYKGTAVDFRDILHPLLKLKPDVVFIPGYSQDSGFIIRQAKNMGVDAVFLGGDAWETAVSKYAGEAIEGSYFSTFWHPNVPHPRSKTFVRNYRATNKEQKISAYAPLGYDAVWLFANAILRSKSLNPETIRDALAGTQNYEGATGRYSFNAYGDPVGKHASILLFEKGHWRFLKAFETQ